MDRLSLNATERDILGKKVKRLRADGQLPGHVYGKGVETEHVSIDTKGFLQTYKQAGETSLIDLKISDDKVRPVLIRGVQYHAVTGKPIHVDFYQVNLNVAVKVPVPIELIGDEPEKVHLGEAIVLQTLNEIEVEALPTDLIEKIEVNISSLKEIDDAITVSQLTFDREKLTITLPDEEVVVKLAPAVSAEMEALLEEQAAETAEAAEEAAAEEGAENAEVEGETAAEGEAPAEGEAAVESETDEKSDS
jgi:large subunit ribosomal protein L25